MNWGRKEGNERMAGEEKKRTEGGRRDEGEGKKGQQRSVKGKGWRDEKLILKKEYHSSCL